MIRYQVKNQCTINVSYISNDIVHKNLSFNNKKTHFYLYIPETTVDINVHGER